MFDGKDKSLLEHILISKVHVYLTSWLVKLTTDI